MYFDTISDAENGIIIITGNIGYKIIFSALISYGTKWSCELISFRSSNADTSTAIVDGDVKKIQFKTSVIDDNVLSLSAKLIK